MFYERTVSKTTANVNETFPVLLVTGPRQVGKSTLLEKMAGSERRRVSLDNPTLRALARTAPELFLQRYYPPVLIEIKIGTGAVICMASDLIPIDKNNWFVPAWII
ncbi:MAG: AAA family ATPase [Clostridia bacterium]|nr:AAA family ATPase [Clostridia bacterium]